jgi:hypothetical protein
MGKMFQSGPDATWFGTRPTRLTREWVARLHQDPTRLDSLIDINSQTVAAFEQR